MSVLVVGEVFVDHHLELGHERLGGIFHAARALSAASAAFGLAYIAPEYLTDQVAEESLLLGATASIPLGTVTGAPNIMLVRDATESGTPGYVDIGRTRRRVELQPSQLEAMRTLRPDDVLVFPGPFEIERVVAALPDARIHVDVQYLPDAAAALEKVMRPLETLFVSVTSPLFRHLAPNIEAFVDWCLQRAQTLVLKEGRGGSRVWSRGQEVTRTPAFLFGTRHSVGVGDCFDVIALLGREQSAPIRFRRASFLASQYAGASRHADYVRAAAEAATADAAVTALAGTHLPWEARPDKVIYVAAPDFPWVDTRALDRLDVALKYHNFAPTLPVRTVGLAAADATSAQRASIYFADRELLDRADLLIAVPLIPDSGTFVELGWCARSGCPTILYAQPGTPPNLFAEMTATVHCSTLDVVIDETFRLLGVVL